MTSGYPAPGVGGRVAIAGFDTSTGPVPMRRGERVWDETNCYLDLCVELVSRLGRDPRPALGAALAAGLEGSQWTFVKPDPGDLRDLCGVDVAETAVWRPVLDHVEELLFLGDLVTVEVDSYWLPDTAGVGYRGEHGKTSVLPVEVDRTERTLTYVHNAGCHRLSGEDFDGVFSDDPQVTRVPLPYVERVRLVPPAGEDGAAVRAIGRHARRADPDAGQRLATRVAGDLHWLRGAGQEAFHRWSFGALRSMGSTAQVCADVCGWLAEEGGVPAANAARAPFLEAARAAKAVQFRAARAARGRQVDAGDGLATLAAGWRAGVLATRDALAPAELS